MRWSELRSDHAYSHKPGSGLGALGLVLDSGTSTEVQRVY